MPDISGTDPGEAFDIQIERDGATAVIHVRGVFDLIYEKPFRKELLELERDAPDKLVLDVAQVTFIDSTGIALLIAAWRRAQRDGYEAEIVLPSNGQARRAFEIAGLDRVITTSHAEPARE
jgi:anti-anti-sigma factor